MSAEARPSPDPTARDEGGRSETCVASGVLLRLLIMLDRFIIIRESRPSRGEVRELEGRSSAIAEASNWGALAKCAWSRKFPASEV